MARTSTPTSTTKTLLKPEFFNRDTTLVAQELLGKVLVHRTTTGIISGRIIETEAYLRDDPASHSYIGPTKRNGAIFGPPGTIYVYFIYGMYWCLNFATRVEGIGEAVLIRGVEPLEGIALMQQRRGTGNIHQLSNGPGKLCQAFAITGEHNNTPLNQKIQVYDDGVTLDFITTPRIGITKAADLPLRFVAR